MGWASRIAAALGPALVLAAWVRSLDPGEATVAPIAEGVELLVLGNSMARTGVDPELLVPGLRAAIVAPDEATVLDAVAALRRVQRSGGRPRLVVVATSAAFLARPRPRSDEALARLLAGLGPEDADLRLLAAGERAVGGWSDRVRATRDRARAWVFGGAARAAVRVVYGEQEAEGAVARWRQAWGPGGAAAARQAVLPVARVQAGSGAQEVDPTAGVELLVAAAAELGAPLAVVLLPTRAPDPTPSGPVEAVVRAAPGAVWLDLSGWRLPDPVWLDDQHVERWGRRALSEGIGQALGALGAPGALVEAPELRRSAGLEVCAPGGARVWGERADGAGGVLATVVAGGCEALPAGSKARAVAVPSGPGWATVWGDPSALTGARWPLLGVRSRAVEARFEGSWERRLVEAEAVDGMLLLPAPELGLLSSAARLGVHQAVNCDPVAVWAAGQPVGPANVARSALRAGAAGYTLTAEGVWLAGPVRDVRYEVGVEAALVGLGCSEGVWVAPRTRLSWAGELPVTGVVVETEGFGGVAWVWVEVEVDGVQVARQRVAVGRAELGWERVERGGSWEISVGVEGEGVVLWREVEWRVGE